VALMKLPERGPADPEILAYWSLVPEDHVLDLISLARGVEHETLIILRARVHHLAERVEGGEHTKKALVEILSILLDIVTQDKHVVRIGSDHRGHVHDVLRRHHKEDIPVAAIHKETADHGVAHEAPVVHAIVHQDEDWWQALLAHPRRNLLLAVHDTLDSLSVVVIIHK